MKTELQFLEYLEQQIISAREKIYTAWLKQEISFRKSELETNSAPNSQERMSQDQIAKAVESPEPDTIQTKHKAEINDSSEIKQLLHKDYPKGCGEIIYGAWNDGDRNYAEPCDGVNYICEKCRKEDLNEGVKNGA